MGLWNTSSLNPDFFCTAGISYRHCHLYCTITLYNTINPPTPPIFILINCSNGSNGHVNNIKGGDNYLSSVSSRSKVTDTIVLTLL